MNTSRLLAVAQTFFYACVATSLFWVSGPLSAAQTKYTFSGDINCDHETYCGPYSGLITIDNAQAGTAVGVGDEYWYEYTNLKVTLADGTEIAATSGEFLVYTNGGSDKEIDLSIEDSLNLRFYWMFANDVFDTSSIAGILASLTSGTPVIPPYVVVFGHSPIDECNDIIQCEGPLSLLTELTPPVIDDTAIVSPDAEIGYNSMVGANSVINKNVSIGEDSNIGENVTINKDTHLGDNSEIGDRSTINKNVTAGDDLTVGKNVTIHKDVVVGSKVTIGDNTEIHSGTVVGNNVWIGANVFIGNLVTIPSNRTIPDGAVISNDTVYP